ncbi:MAG: glycine zipper 2TM domain-containing protein [Acetobacteraceae bacterium]
MPAIAPALRLLAVLALAGGALAACGPAQTANTIDPWAVGRPGAVSTGTIVAMRPVQVRGTTGVGAPVGAVAGGVIGSGIGGGWRANALGAIGGAVVGGLAGAAVEQGVTGGTAVEFIIRDDRGGEIAVVQTNEDRLMVGDRVRVVHADRTRITRIGAGMAAADIRGDDK